MIVKKISIFLISWIIWSQAPKTSRLSLWDYRCRDGAVHDSSSRKENEDRELGVTVSLSRDISVRHATASYVISSK